MHMWVKHVHVLVGAAFRWRVFKKLCREFSSSIEAKRHSTTQSSLCEPSSLVDSSIHRTTETSQTPQAEPVVLPDLSISTCSLSTVTPLLDTVSQARSVCKNALDHVQVKEQLLWVWYNQRSYMYTLGFHECFSYISRFCHRLSSDSIYLHPCECPWGGC